VRSLDNHFLISVEVYHIKRTGLWLAYCFGSLTWSAGSLMGFLSREDKKALAKFTSDMIVRWNPLYKVSFSVK
jgi:hypothetical protein